MYAHAFLRHGSYATAIGGRKERRTDSDRLTQEGTYQIRDRSLFIGRGGGGGGGYKRGKLLV